MKKVAIILLCSACSLVPRGQGMPRWADAQSREADYPAHTYITGFVIDDLLPPETLAQATARLKAAAWGALSENIRIMVSKTTYSETASMTHSGKYSEMELFGAEITTQAGAEMVGVSTDVYFDKAKKTLYAFAYANRRELMTYYGATATADLQQIKSTVKTAAQLEKQHEKAKARKQYNDAKKLLEKTEKMLTLLRALDANSFQEAWQLERQTLNDEVTQALARVELAVYVNAREDLFGQPCAIVAHKLQAKLTEAGYRFITDEQAADYTLYIRATTRKVGDAATTIVFCFADVVVEWVDGRTRKIMYKDEQSHKGGSTTWERAGREALETAAEAIMEKLNKIIA
jgi:hypothetical protein